MDTSILYTRIKEYKDKAKNPTSKEMILLFESWFTTIENYLSDVELDNFRLNLKVTSQENLISSLCDLLIISGNADKLVIDIEQNKEAILLLLKNGDRINHNSITAISALLQIYPDVKFESLKQLKDHADRQ